MTQYFSEAEREDVSVNSFADYLQRHHIEPLGLSLLAGVRYLTVWNAMQGRPISVAHAAKICAAVVHLTGVPYTGVFPTLQERATGKRGKQP